MNKKLEHFEAKLCEIFEEKLIKLISRNHNRRKLFDDLNDENIEEFLMGDRLADGGAAMTAYAMMQFTEMSQGERDRIIQGLLKYCELDTLAMVLLWEGWNYH